MWQLDVLIPLILVGASAGFLAGLLGIGGGTVIVPIMVWVLDRQQIGGAFTQHLAIGTSFAVMVFTTFSGALAQHRKGTVRWDVVLAMSPAMVLCGLLGSLVARYIPTVQLQMFFTFFIYLLAFQVFFGVKPKEGNRLPSKPVTAGVGGIVGAISSWVGIGGGSLSVPFLLHSNIPVHQATATSAGLAWPMAVSGAIGYLVAGWNVEGLPDGSFGFWYLPAVAILACCTVFIAPFGVRVAHKLPAPLLKKCVGVLMFVIATQMLLKWI